MKHINKSVVHKKITCIYKIDFLILDFNFNFVATLKKTLKCVVFILIENNIFSYRGSTVFQTNS